MMNSRIHGNQIPITGEVLMGGEGGGYGNRKMRAEDKGALLKGDGTTTDHQSCQ